MARNNLSYSSLLFTVVGCYGVSTDAILADAVQSFSEEDTQAVSLLQLKSAATHFKANTSRARGAPGNAPGNAERQLCPHEIEQIESMPVFGCRGTLRAESTRECSMWGEPHFSRSWPTQFDGKANSHFSNRNYDVLYKPGLFRMAAAADGSWEVQVLNCGQYASSLALRFGKTVIEIVTPPKTHDRFDDGTYKPLLYFINGKPYHGEFPISQGDLFVDNTHRRIISDGWSHKEQRQVLRDQNGGWGACVDDPGGQIYGEVFKNEFGNINILLQAAEGSYTTTDTDAFSLCNLDLNDGWFQRRFHSWEVQMVSAEDSLFIGSGSAACKFCENMATPWLKGKAADVDVAKATCEAMIPKEFEEPTMEEICQTNGIPMANAEAACAHLKDDPEFFGDCQLDFCAARGDPDAVENAEQEEHAENPQPICAIADDTCNPASACCGALKDQAILEFANVVQNNLCGDGDGAQEIRYSSVLTQRGQEMDLVVTPSGSFDCGRATNGKNGAKSDSIGVIAIQAGTEATLNFAFVESGTNTPATPSSLMFSFLDLDQGKKGKQRESVEVCGALNAIVTDNSELEQSINGNCIKYTSTTWGTRRDNPESPASLSHGQRARVVAYQVAGSSFTATLGVSKKGNNPRRFTFAGHPSVACVLN